MIYWISGIRAKNMAIYLLLERMVVKVDYMKSTLISPSELHGIAMSKVNGASMCCDRKARAPNAQELKFCDTRHSVWSRQLLQNIARTLTEQDNVIEKQTRNCMRSQIVHATSLSAILCISKWTTSWCWSDSFCRKTNKLPTKISYDFHCFSFQNIKEIKRSIRI